jgi:hypothetical protein
VCRWTTRGDNVLSVSLTVTPEGRSVSIQGRQGRSMRRGGPNGLGRGHAGTLAWLVEGWGVGSLSPMSPPTLAADSTSYRFTTKTLNAWIRRGCGTARNLTGPPRPRENLLLEATLSRREEPGIEVAEFE